MKSRYLLSLCAAFVAACSGDEGTGTETTDVGRGVDGGADASPDVSDWVDVGADVAPDASVAGDTVPSEVGDASPPVLLPILRGYSGGACPVLESGANTVSTSGGSRDVTLYLPDAPDGAPLLFWYYGTGDSASNYRWMQSIADDLEIAIAIPHAKGDRVFEWPIMASDDTAGELAFFDDLTICITAQFELNTGRIYASGFSAGALWTTYLSMQRSDTLAAVGVFSGGTGSLVRPYDTPAYPIPVLGLYGGSGDVYGGFVNFADQMQDYMDSLVADGHYVIACDHGLGHSVPSDVFDWGLSFLVAHAWDVPSPFTGVPSFLPRYCEVWE